MPRDKETVRRRLQQAALDLFAERGYETTTAADIARQAGVTERTFFRHFPDKREILFDGENAFMAALAQGVASAPPGAGPLQVLFRAFVEVEAMLEGNRAFAEPRAQLIAAVPALRERSLAKTAALKQVLADALVQRGVAERRATLAAHAGTAAFEQAFHAWLAQAARSMHQHLIDAFDDLDTLATFGRSAQ